MLTQILLLFVAIATGYQLFSLVCAWLFARWQRRELARPRRPDADLPGVTMLKPLCGAVPETYDNLASTCRLDYPKLQIVFGVADASDPAIAIVKRLQRDFPEVDVELVVSPDRIGSNAKVSNLHNMVQRAKHEVLVIADGDIRAPRDYLRTIVPYLDEPQTGLVTCMYRGIGSRTLANRVEALFINTDFGPMVTVARQVERMGYAFGATICIRRELFEKMGGFRAIADHLADDFQLGAMVVERGLTSVLSPVVAETVLDLDTMREVYAHQLRWARTYRICRPGGYLASIVTHSTLWATLYLLAAGFSAGALQVFAAAVGVRLVAAGLIAHHVLGMRRIWRQLLLVPAKDLFISSIWVAAFLGRTVQWGGTEFEVAPDGRMTPLGANDEPQADPAPAQNS